MQASSLTPHSPFLQRFSAYLTERFPPLSHVVLIVSYYSSNQFLAQVLSHPGHPLHYSLWSLAGAVSVLCGFFYLRVFDEHKDFAEDCVFHPERLLQRGIISLRELRLAGGIAVALQLFLSAISGLAALTSSLLVLLYALLMLKEFFVRNWLKKQFLLYALSHMLIMPLYSLQVFSFTTGLFFFEAPPWFLAYAFVGFFVTLNWEISRKIRAPEQEVAGLDSYSKTLGTYGSGYAVLIVRLIDSLLVAAVGYHIGVSAIFYILLFGLYLVCCYGFLQFRFKTSPRTAKNMEKYAGIYIVAFDLLLAFELIRLVGIAGS